MMRMMSGGRFMCMGSHLHERKEVARLRGEVDDLREQLKKRGVTVGASPLPARNVADAAAAGRCYFTNRTGHRQKMPTL